jgi:Lar family restriction alleviation protein
MSMDLKPCPFCGSHGDMLRMSGNGADTFWVTCDICEADGPVAAKETEAGAIEGWNLRTNSQDALIAELAAAVEPLARLEVPKRRQGNAAFYSLLHADIERAQAILAKVRPVAGDDTRIAELAAVQLAYGLLWHMSIDNRDPNLKLASDARKALLSTLSKDGQLRGIDAAKMTDGRFTGAA